MTTKHQPGPINKDYKRGSSEICVACGAMRFVTSWEPCVPRGPWFRPDPTCKSGYDTNISRCPGKTLPAPEPDVECWECWDRGGGCPCCRELP